MKTKKEEIIEGLNEMSIHSEAQKQCIKDTIDYIESLNPYKIDEERYEKIYDETDSEGCVSYKEGKRAKKIIAKYNSTASEPLVPLPSEMPDDIFKVLDRYKIFIEAENKWNWHFTDLKWVWDVIYKHYGTPPRQELPSVDELKKELADVWDSQYAPQVPVWELLAQHLVTKYKLPSQPREWWMDLKVGDKFMVNNKIQVFSSLMINSIKGDEYFIDACTPYVEPVMTAESVISKHNLSELEVKAIREATT